MKDLIFGRSSKAFTLIELLIVVAIIAILAAIAVPNFLEAQTRSKVSRVKADMRSIATAVESYYVDYNRYPIAGQWVAQTNFFNNRLKGITTPVAYMTSLPIDIFWKESSQFPVTPGTQATFEYEDFTTAVTGEQLGTLPDYQIFATRGAMTAYYGNQGEVAWVLNSAGPDRINDFQTNGPNPLTTPVSEANALIEGTNRTYDPTNGTISGGDVARTNAQQRN